MLALEHIVEDAAHWLLGRIAGAETLHLNTLAVQRRLRHGAGHPHPYLADNLEKVAI